MQKAMGQRVREMRKLVFRNQTEAGRAVGLSQSRWGAIERGETDAKDHRHAIAKALGVRIEWLLYGEDPMRPGVRPGVGPPVSRVAEPVADHQANIGQLLYQMSGDLRQLLDDCHDLRQRMARLEAGAGAADDHQGANAG